MSRHQFPDKTDYSLGPLTRELLAALGTGTAVSFNRDTGEFAVVDAEGNELEVDEAIVAQVVAAHVPPARPLSPIEQLATALAGSGTTTEKLGALQVWARAEADAQAPPTRTLPDRTPRDPR